MSKNANSKPVPQQKQPDLALLAASSHSLVYSGPLPPASEMEKYEKICPGAADRIISMAEKQAEHRQSIEAVAIKASSERSILGVKYAFYIAIAAFTLSGVCFCLGHVVAGSAIFGSALVSLVTSFIYGTKSNRQEREEKWDKTHQSNVASTKD